MTISAQTNRINRQIATICERSGMSTPEDKLFFLEELFCKYTQDQKSAITCLNLSSFDLEHLPLCLKEFPNLKELNLDKNRLSSLDDLPSLPLLQKLTIAGNHIRIFSNAFFGKTPQIKHLDLRNNPISFATIDCIASIKCEIILSGNNLHAPFR